MDNTNQTSNQMPPMTQGSGNTSSIGGIISIIIIIAIIILGGLYFWGKRVEESKTEKALTSEEGANQQANVINSTSSLDTLDSINADLNTTQTTNLDTELR